MQRGFACFLSFVVAIGIGGCIDDAPTPLGTESLGSTPRDLHSAYAAGNGNVVELDLYVDEAFSWSPHEGKDLHGFAFGLTTEDASVPGPTIRVTQGDTVRVTLHSGGGFSDQPHTIHWHGISLPWGMDGVPYMTQHVVGTEANSFTYEWVATHPGTYWYHCHVEAPAHVDIGMFGALIIDPADPAEDPHFDREATLMLHEMDSRFQEFVQPVAAGSYDPADPRTHHPMDYVEGTARAGRMITDIGGLIVESATGVDTWGEGPRDYYPAESLRYRPEYDTFMINGKSFPETEPVLIGEGETLRVRLINAGQHVHTMHLHGHHFLVTHKDGYLLSAPYWADTLAIASGERYDIYIEGYNPGIWDFHDHGGASGIGGFASNNHAFPGGMATVLAYEGFDSPLPEPTPGATSGDYRIFAYETAVALGHVPILTLTTTHDEDAIVSPGSDPLFGGDGTPTGGSDADPPADASGGLDLALDVAV